MLLLYFYFIKIKLKDLSSNLYTFGRFKLERCKSYVINILCV